jgi:uncharacterized protein
MYGFSYQGYTQIAAAASGAPALRAIAPHMTAFDLYSGWFYQNGLLHLKGTLGWGHQMLREDVLRQHGAHSPLYRKLEEDWGKSNGQARALPVAAIKPLTAPDGPPYVRDWIEHSTKDSFWEALDLTAKAARSGLPMFHLSGWYDFFLRGSIGGYEQMVAHPGSGPQTLVAGPWVHIPWGDRAGSLGFGPQARFPTDRKLLAFLNYWLKEDESWAEEATTSHYFELGSGQWKSIPSWPPPGTITTSFFLASKGSANSAFGDGFLNLEAPEGPPDTFNYDPETPVPAPGGTFGGDLAWGPFDISTSQQGNNLLVFTTSPFDRAQHLAGTPRLRLFVSSSAPETAFVARLSRVANSGTAAFLCLGATIVSGANEGVREVSLSFDPTACAFAPGEALRLDLSSSAFPLLVRHPNTTTDPAQVNSPSAFRRALQVVYHDRERPSSLHLPTTAS